MNSNTWDQLTTTVLAAITLGSTIIGALCYALVKILPAIKQAQEALREIGILKTQVDANQAKLAAHKEVLVNLAVASPSETSEILEPLLKKKETENDSPKLIS